MARPGSLKAAAKPTTPAWYNGDVDGNGMIGLLVHGRPSHLIPIC